MTLDRDIHKSITRLVQRFVKDQAVKEMIVGPTCG